MVTPPARAEDASIALSDPQATTRNRWRTSGSFPRTAFSRHTRSRGEHLPDHRIVIGGATSTDPELPQTQHLGAPKRVVRDNERLEIQVINQSVAVQVRGAARGHARIGTVKQVVRDDEDLEVRVIDEAV